MNELDMVAILATLGGVILGVVLGWAIFSGPKDRGSRAEDHVLIYGMLSTLPNMGEEFQDTQKAKWIEAMELILDVVWVPTEKEPEKQAEEGSD